MCLPIIILGVILVLLVIHFGGAFVFWGLNIHRFRYLEKSLMFALIFSFIWESAYYFAHVAKKKFIEACPDGKKKVICHGEAIINDEHDWYCMTCHQVFEPQVVANVKKHGHYRDSDGWAKFKKSFWYVFY